MALNYANQFKYTGNGYLDKKMQPVSTLDELKAISKEDIYSYYQPGMKVTVLNDDMFGEVDYILTENGEWKRLIDLEELKLNVDKGEFTGDNKDEMYIQLEYKDEVLSTINIAEFFSDLENKIQKEIQDREESINTLNKKLEEIQRFSVTGDDEEEIVDEIE
jgi:hypothetical protein